MDWNTFVYDNEPYIIKSVNDKTTYKIILSNTINMWIEELTVVQISERSKELNPIISTDAETYLDTVLSMLNNISSNNDVVVNKLDENINLECKTKLIDTPFKFTFYLKVSETGAFCTELTIPLIQTIQLLESRQKELFKVIEQNNEVIAQHVFENGPIKRVFDHVYKYNKEEYISSLPNTLCCNVLSKNEFKKCILEKHPGPPELLSPLVRNVNKRKKGPSLVKQILKRRFPKK